MSGGPEARAVVVTRDEPTDGPLSRELRSRGLTVLNWPAISVTPAAPAALRAALGMPGQFDWIVFASRHAVAAVLELRSEPPPGLKIAAVGHATAQVLTQRGWTVDLLPGEANAAALVDAFAALPGGGAGLRVLYPASSRALPTLAAGLRQLGCAVEQAEAYHTGAAALDVEECRARIAHDEIAAVTFASPSAVDELAQALGTQDFGRLLRAAPAVAIGRTTARALRERGVEAVLAASATLAALAAATHRLVTSRA